MGNIQDLLAQILSARYGRDVRQSIHDAIETCYEDGHAGAIDLQARTLLGDTDISEISETVTGAVVELDGAVGTAQTTADGAVEAAQTAQNTADEKLSPNDAWKIGTIDITEENVTINSLSTHTFSIDIPTGVSNVIALNARSSDTTRTLVPINLFASAEKIYAVMSNQSANTMTATMTIKVTYAYK